MGRTINRRSVAQPSHGHRGQLHCPGAALERPDHAAATFTITPESGRRRSRARARSPSRRPRLARMRPNARALAQAHQFRTNVVTGSVLLGFVGGVIFYVTRAISQDDINDAELEAFKAQREAKAQPK